MEASLERPTIPTPPPSPPPTFCGALGHRWGGHRAAESHTGELLQRVLAQAGAGVFGRALHEMGRAWDLERERFTIFAPSDEALAELPPGFLDDPERLRRIVGFHLHLGSALRSDELRCDVPSAIGQRLRVQREGDSIGVDEARVLWPDLCSGVGVIHIIDRLLMPAELDMLELLHISDNFHRLVSACELVGVEEQLRGDEPHTLLAPRGLIQLPTWHWHALLKPCARDQLRQLIRRHVVPGRWYLDECALLHNLEHEQLPIEKQGREGYRVADRRVLVPNIDTRNGLIHVLEGLVR